MSYVDELKEIVNFEYKGYKPFSLDYVYCGYKRERKESFKRII